MRGLIFGLVTLALGTSSALATDYHEKPQPSGTHDWSGAQIGLLYGYGWMKDFNTVLRLEAEGDGDVFGAYAAFNQQMGHFVAGGEISYSRHDNLFTDGSGVEVGDLFSAKLRAGGAYDRVMAYANIGFVRGTTNLAGNDWGFVYGFGVDAMITPNIVAGLQYNRYNFVNFNYTFIDADIDELTGRLGYKF